MSERFTPNFKSGNERFSTEMNGGSTGTRDYNKLNNKPSINDVTLEGALTDEELYLQHKMNRVTEQEIDKILFGGL